MTKMWGGRFEGRLDPFFEQFNRSIEFDHELAEYDLRVNRAWARALGGAGVLDEDDVAKLVAACDELDERWSEDGLFVDPEFEDVHSFVEFALTELVGDLARRLHTGRSRNDQVATDLRLFAFDRTAGVLLSLQALVAELVALAERYADAPMPGYTHLQRAQPITIGHHALAYVEMLARDISRLASAWDRAAQCPLGSAALAGTAFPVDREAIAEELEFPSGPTRNSLDAVADRDFVCEMLFCCSTTMLHLSRFAEDWIFFASHEAGFLKLSDAVATGSSLMPQKKNPDALELIRGKTGRVVGALHGMQMTLKGLPLAYDKDLQEDKEGFFDAVGQTEACLEIATTVVRTAEFDVERCRAACERGYLDATDLADLIVKAGVPFRDAHEQVGRAVRAALERGVELRELPDDDLAELVPGLGPAEIRAALAVDAIVARRDVVGGTAPDRVRAECARWREEIASWQD